MTKLKTLINSISDNQKEILKINSIDYKNMSIREVGIFMNWQKSDLRNGYIIATLGVLEFLTKADIPLSQLSYNDLEIAITNKFGTLHNAEIIQDNFYQITPKGLEEFGIIAFVNWCHKRGYEITIKANQYIQDFNKYQSHKNNLGLVDASNKNIGTSYLDKVYYCDFYTHGNFGKTKLGSWTFYGKSGPNKNLIDIAIETVKDTIRNFVITQKIDAVGFIAPTNERTIQLMTELQNTLNLQLPKILITKVITPVRVAQKSLKSMDDRIENASQTFTVASDKAYNNILLIDDLIGSGSTLNQIAKKLRNQNIATGSITGLAMVGSENGIVNNSTKFETVTEA